MTQLHRQGTEVDIMHSVTTKQIQRTPGYADIRALVHECVNAILGEDLYDESDLFRAGADSLCTLSIRNAIVQRLTGSALMDEKYIQFLPRDILYVLPSISQLAAFIYGIIHISKRTKELASDSYPITEKDVAVREDNADVKWQTILQSKETVTELKKGDGVPLIILHGASGTMTHFGPFTRCSCPILGVQVTDETPVDTIETWAQFYFEKIKEKRPEGPYRLTSYSGTCVLILELVMLFQRNGDRVVQLTMLDHFPIFFCPSLDPNLVDLDSSKWFEDHVRQCLVDMMEIIVNSSGEMGAHATLRHEQLKTALSGGPIAPQIKVLIKRVTPLIRTSLRYLTSDRFMESIDHAGVRSKRWSPTQFREFVSTLDPVLSVYVAKEGIRSRTPTHLMDTVYEDLGARQFFPRAIIRHIDGNHLDFLDNEYMLQSLESEFQD